MSGSIQNRRIKVKILVLSLLASFFSMGISQNANASEGAGVWAVVDSSGTVTNVIVCTQSVCGGGTFGGERVVPQIAPNPITNNAEGQGSFIGNESAGIRVTESNGIFTVHENVRINSTEIEVTVNDKAKTTTISEVSIPVTSRSFSYNDTIGKTYSEIKLKNESYDDERPTNILVKQKTSKLLSSETLSSETLSSELISIVGRKTASELEIILIQNQLDLIRSKIDNLIKMLGGWIKP
jgi:hypothetical protein